MMSLHAIQNAARASHYFSAQDDYYSKEGSGVWLGEGAQCLGLEGAVASEEFSTFLEGKLPDGSRIPVTIDQKFSKRLGWDFTFSAPKSVSLQALIAGDKDVTRAHQEAVRTALSQMQKHAVARRTVNGRLRREHTYNLVAAAFDHELSRVKDPQLHTHVIVMNMTQRSDGKWRALANEELFKHRMLFDAIYRADLAKRLQDLGYEIRLIDKEGGFELAHINRAQIEAFSHRSLVIEKTLANRGKTRDSASAIEKELITLITRPKKDILTLEDKRLLMETWRERSVAAGLQFDTKKVLTLINDHKSANLAAESLEFAIAHLSERQSIMLDSVLITAAMQHAVGRATHVELRAELKRKIRNHELIAEETLYKKGDEKGETLGKTRKEWRAEFQKQTGKASKDAFRFINHAIRTGRLIPSEPRYTTARAWQSEKLILKLEQDGRNRLKPILQSFKAEPLLQGTDLNPGQMQAAKSVLTSRNRIIGIQGSAGVGKSHLLKVTSDIAEKAGYRVVVVAPYANQVERLQADGLKAATLATFLVSKDKSIDHRTVLVCDEAGLVPVREMEAYLKVAEKYGARVVLSGDIQQLKAIEAGRPFAQLQAHGMKTIVLDHIQRQKTADLKAAVDLAAKGKAAASLTNIERHVREVSDEQARYNEIAALYTGMAQGQREKTLIVSGTNEARRELNTRIRRKLGIEGSGVSVDTLSRRDLTQVERRNAPSYCINDYIQPERDYPYSDLKRGQLYRVEDIEKDNHLVLSDSEGKRFNINPKSHAHLSVYQKSSTEFAVDDWARITRNDPALDVSNGDRVRVTALNIEHIRVTNEKGREIELDRRRPLFMEHAYATTVHSAQGLTADQMIVDLNTRSLTTGKDLYYVAISRAREQAIVFTNSKAELPAAIGRENIKTAALDVRRASGPSLSHGM